MKYRIEETHARIQEIARENAERRAGMGYDVKLFDGEEGVAVVRAGTRLPAETEVYDSAKARDIETAERFASDDGYYPVERWSVRTVDIEIMWADGQAQRFSRAFRIA